MVIGRRTDVLIRNRTLYDAHDVADVARAEGKLHSAYGMDYFAIANNSYPWHLIPDFFVIGRPGYDNYLVAMALMSNMCVVDATRTVVALHQTDEEGISSGERSNNSNYNKRLHSMKQRHYMRQICNEICNCQNKHNFYS